MSGVQYPVKSRGNLLTLNLTGTLICWQGVELTNDRKTRFGFFSGRAADKDQRDAT